jgi:hypothetical protein
MFFVFYLLSLPLLSFLFAQVHIAALELRLVAIKPLLLLLPFLLMSRTTASVIRIPWGGALSSSSSPCGPGTETFLKEPSNASDMK